MKPNPNPLTKTYEPAAFESLLYSYWEKNGYFEANDANQPGQNAFCMVIPPPNVTGALHMGHALTNTIQDILIRWRRMKGDNTLWLPGTDHAGIATQAQVEKSLAREKKSRHSLGRSAFVEKVWEWKEKHGGIIQSQLKRLGSSLDWKRERFTLDEGLSHAVREVFVRLYEEGLIYRGERIIHWCTRCQTALSDLEVIPTERKATLWKIAYSLEENPEKKVIIATTRPETLLGDTAVAVHPEDERYQFAVGKKVVLPVIRRPIPVIADSYVDREFGTGALKVTPAHDFNDYELGRKHRLPSLSVMGKDGKITAEGGPYAGLKFSEAREKILSELQASGELIGSEDYTHQVGLCQRCDSIVEPLVSKQWFVQMEPLAKPAIEAVRERRITFHPEAWSKTYFEWMLNIRDWCISRQLWWGHQIPAWHCEECAGITVSRETPQRCSQCSSVRVVQDEDVLDTWFSSALWPFSTLGWPERTAALQTFYPTAILETGFDILFFWVARMIMMGLHFMGEVPFRRVYLHAMVRDEKGEKMSKTKGNVIDPLEVIDRLGADPLRFHLASMAGQGRDIKLSVERVEGTKAFCNKIWNATKFCLMHWENFQEPGFKIPAEGWERFISKNADRLSLPDRWILSRLQVAVEEVEGGFENFELNRATQGIQRFAWNEYCDWYLEFSKLNLKEQNEASFLTLGVMTHVLESLLKLAHPVMPFVTEELWQRVPGQQGETLMLQSFPKRNAQWIASRVESEIAALQAAVDAVRNFKGENNISPKQEFPVQLFCSSEESLKLFEAERPLILNLARISGLEIKRAGADPVKKGEVAIPITGQGLELRIPIGQWLNLDEEKKRLKKEMEKIAADIEFISRKLSNQDFIAKAPEALVAKEKARLEELRSKERQLQGTLTQFSS